VTDTAEQLRRLKNTIMGVSHRLTLLSKSPELARESDSLLEVATALQSSVEELERLLASVRSGR
jgi:hypothetical protein